MGWKYNLIANPEFNHQHKANKNQKEKHQLRARVQVSPQGDSG